jgi:hypothetical protein
MNIILAGIMGRYPYGGVAWCSLMYLLGLKRLGHQVWYFEDMKECNFDPVANTSATNPKYATNFINESLSPYEFSDKWCYIDYKGNYHGMRRESWLKICAKADLYLNLSGGCWLWRDEYAAIPYSAFIDSDPAFTQLLIAEGGSWQETFFPKFNRLFTFGRNIGTSDSPVPTGSLSWEHTWQPICPDEWTPSQDPPRPFFTTIMSWKIFSFENIGGNKDVEFMKILNLPSVSKVPIELAMTGPIDLLEKHGWHCRDAFSVSHNLNSYRDYIQSSLGEFSVAKNTYVRTNSGWFSDRTECYLASGRPAVVQDTGFSSHLPVNEGLFSYKTIDEAKESIDEVLRNYKRHSLAARELALSHFAYQIVLPPLLERATTKTESI